MNVDVEELARQALSLPNDQRYALATRIWESLEDAFAQTEPMSESVRAAAREAMRRDAEMKSGDVAGRTHEEVMARLQQILACD